MGITFPSYYPNGAAPSFILDSNTTIYITSQQELMKVQCWCYRLKCKHQRHSKVHSDISNTIPLSYIQLIESSHSNRSSLLEVLYLIKEVWAGSHCSHDLPPIFGKTYIVIIVDKYLKWADVWEMASAKAAKICSVCMDSYPTMNPSSWPKNLVIS